MNAQEAALLCRYVKACCPQQAIDEYTPAAWGDLLDDIRLDDAKLAVKALVKRQPFVAPAEIRAEVKRIRSKRIAEHPPLVPPPGLDNAQEHAWLAAATVRIGDGETYDNEQPYGELVHDMPRVRELLAAATPDTGAHDATQQPDPAAMRPTTEEQSHA